MIIAECLEDDRLPGPHLKQHFNDAKELPREAFAFAASDKEDLSEDQQQLRRAALEVARLWFTAHLHTMISKMPMNIKILMDSKWRL
jgi:hypothetical protein